MSSQEDHFEDSKPNWDERAAERMIKLKAALNQGPEAYEKAFAEMFPQDGIRTPMLRCNRCHASYPEQQTILVEELTYCGSCGPYEQEVADRVAFAKSNTFTANLQKRYPNIHPTTGNEEWPPPKPWSAWITYIVELVGNAMVLFVVGWFIYEGIKELRQWIAR